MNSLVAEWAPHQIDILEYGKWRPLYDVCVSLTSPCWLSTALEVSAYPGSRRTNMFYAERATTLDAATLGNASVCTSELKVWAPMALRISQINS